MSKRYPQIVFGEDGTIDVALFAPGEYHDGQAVYTEADLNEMIAGYNPQIHEAPSVIGHKVQRRSSDPAYGWFQDLFWKDGQMWGRLKQVPDEFKEWVKKGLWKKRSIEVYTDFQGTGKKYLRAVAWLGAQPPEVKGLPDVAFAEGDGPVETLEFDQVDERGRLQRIYDELKQLFAEDGAAEDGPIQKTMAQEEALSQFERIRWIASDELWQIVYDDELEPEEKRTRVRALFDELTQLIENNGEALINSFSERSEDMNRTTSKPGQGTIALTPEQMQEQISAAVSAALVSFEERQEAKIQERVNAGLADVQAQARRTGIAAFCEQLRKQGLAPAIIDETGLQVFMEGLNLTDAQVFAEGSPEQTPMQFFQDFLEKVVRAGKEGKLLVEFQEVGAGSKTTAPQGGDLKARALADFEEHRATYEAMGLTAEDLEDERVLGG